MIEYLAARRRYWDNPNKRAPREEHDLTDSLPYPFEPVEHLFHGKDVLEIGPGRGRQYVRLKDVVRSYAICDISPCALQEPVFTDLAYCYLLSDYEEVFGQFDVVHFWYVLHHIRTEELGDFFAFVARNLCDDGLAIFNSPQTGNDKKWYTGTGLGTTWIDARMVLDACRPHLSITSSIWQDDRSSGHLFVASR